jgi:nucleoside-diphosphate-sugar epimerase
VHADLRDYKQALRVVEGADVVYHLAARVGSIDYLHGSSRAELQALQSNLAIDANVFRACIEKGISRIVYASSVSVYPMDKQDKLGAEFRENEIFPLNPEGGYGWAKIAGEMQLQLMQKVKSSVARIFNVYGEFSQYGESAQLIPALIRKAVRFPSEPFVVWGDGHQTRCMLYVKDCVEALVKLEERVKIPPLVLNVGNPEVHSIREIAELIIKTSGKSIPILFDKTKPVGPISRIPDINLARRELSWSPKTTLKNGIARTYDWLREEILGETRRRL